MKEVTQIHEKYDVISQMTSLARQQKHVRPSCPNLLRLGLGKETGRGSGYPSPSDTRWSENITQIITLIKIIQSRKNGWLRGDENFAILETHYFIYQIIQ